MLTYDKYRPKAQTGDMICFSGNGLVSTGVKVGTRSKWSHIGKVIRASEWDMVLSFESTLLCRVADIESGFVKRGIMLVPLEARIVTYDGKMAIRRIINPLTVDQLLILRDYRQEVKNRPYEKNYAELIKSAYDGPFGKNTHDLSSIFCSENFAEPFIRMGILPSAKIKVSNEYTPADLCEDDKFSEIWEPSFEIIVSV